HGGAGAPVKLRAAEPSSAKVAPRTAPASRHEAESVSLIDTKKSPKKTEDGEVKTKHEVLHPISRIRASLEAPGALPRPAPPAKTEAAPPPQKESPGVIGDGTTAPTGRRAGAEAPRPQ